MDRFVSKPLTVPVVDGQPTFTRADIIFYEVDHSGDSFEARIFLNNADADENTPKETEHGYAGYFSIFGHGGCAGDVGHCEVPADQNDPDDLRLAHPLTPATKPVIITDAVQALAQPRFTVTVVPVLPGRTRPRRADVLHFHSFEILTYD